MKLNRLAPRSGAHTLSYLLAFSATVLACGANGNSGTATGGSVGTGGGAPQDAGTPPADADRGPDVGGSRPDIGSNTPVPPPPTPEPISMITLPLPPHLPSGTCTTTLNPNGTGCITAANGGSFTIDSHHALASVTYAGAPTAPDPASIFAGGQVILVKTDGTTFANGDPWKCLTCGMPSGNAQGVTSMGGQAQTFPDGKRMLTDARVIFDCSPHLLTDKECTPDRLHAYPIRWNVTADGSGPGGSNREIRVHPDNVHLGFNAYATSPTGKTDQFGYLGRLEFNANPVSGTPLVPRYDLNNVYRMFKEDAERTVRINPANPQELVLDYSAIEIGEFRGFTGDGQWAAYVGFPHESSNIDVFAVHLTTGAVRRLTSHPEYCDPLDFSRDSHWFVAEDTRGSNRSMFLAAMRWIPPITDAITTGAVSSVRNNGQRRFFQPYLIDEYGDRGDYFGQQLNAGNGAAGSANDPNWNARADPRWAWDGTAVAFYQVMVRSPACGGATPLPCPTSTEPGGRDYRFMMAKLTSRTPTVAPTPAPIPDEIPWGTPYVPGTPLPARTLLPAGTYTLRGRLSGEAKVNIAKTAGGEYASVTVEYTNYSDVADYTINGTERVANAAAPMAGNISLDWSSNLTQSGTVSGTKKSSDDGYHLNINLNQTIIQSTGSFTSTVDGVAYTNPPPGT